MPGAPSGLDTHKVLRHTLRFQMIMLRIVKLVGVGARAELQLVVPQ